MEFKTKRLFLKNLDSSDREFLLEHFSDEEVCRYLYDAEPFRSLKEADELVDFYNEPEPRKQARWILVLLENGKKIGTCGFHRYDKEHGSAEIGYDLQKEYWGEGYMSEALDVLLPYQKEKWSIRKLSAHIYPENLNSSRLAERIGLRKSSETMNYNFRGKNYLHSVYVWEK